MTVQILQFIFGHSRPFIHHKVTSFQIHHQHFLQKQLNWLSKYTSSSHSSTSILYQYIDMFSSQIHHSTVIFHAFDNFFSTKIIHTSSKHDLPKEMFKIFIFSLSTQNDVTEPNTIHTFDKFHLNILYHRNRL